MKRLFLLMALLMTWICGVHSQSTSRPPAPQEVRAIVSQTGQNRVMLTWSSEDGAWSFKIYRSPGDSLHFSWIAHTPGEQYQDLNVRASTKYYYYVTAADTSGRESGPSTIVSATTGDTLLPSSGIITGIVIDDSTSLPIRGIRVRLFTTDLESAQDLQGSTITDSSGRYTVQVDTGTYLVRFESMEETESSAHYGTLWFDGVTDPSNAKSIEIALGDTATASARLHRLRQSLSASVSGVVADSLGHSLRGAEVAVLRSIPELASVLPDSEDSAPFTEIRNLPGLGYLRGVVWSGTTDSTGRYKATVPQGGPYMVLGWATGYSIQVFEGQWDPTQANLLSITGDTTGIDFFLHAGDSTGNSLQGGVKDSNGTGVAGRVILFPRPISGVTITPALYVNTNSSGSFTFQNVPAGSYSILAIPYSDFAPSYYKAGSYDVEQWNGADSIRVTGAVTNITIGVNPLSTAGAATVNGVIRTTGGSPVVGGRIVFSSSATGLPVAFSLTDANGHYSVAGIPAGVLSVVVDHPPFLSVSGNLVMPANTFTVNNVDFILDPLASVPGGEGFGRPAQFLLSQNYPNPFNPKTVISGQWTVDSNVRLEVFDILGRKVATLANGRYPAGKYTFAFDGTNLASGMYLCRLTAGSNSAVRKMLLIR